jgi:soluble lytic murein transglycosylase-like protein
MRYVSSFVCLFFVFIMLSASTSSCDRPITDGSYNLNSSTNQSGTDYRAMAEQDAINAGIPADRFVKQINQESGFNPNVVSRAGAIGIAQIMPGTAQSWNVNPWDPTASLKASAEHMAWYQNNYGDYRKALVCYNAGCGTLQSALRNCSYYYWCLPNETQRYIDNIMS